MPVWNRTVQLEHLVAQWKNDEITIPELAEKVVDQIGRSGWLEDTPYPDTLRDHLGRLRQATDAAEYKAAFEYVYDVADQDRVWIETW